MKTDSKTLRFPKKVMLFLFSLYLILGCQREKITEIIDDGIPPKQPMGLKIVYAFDGEIDLQWQANREEGIAGYNIYRAVNNPVEFSKIDFTKDIFYTDGYLDYDSLYIYRITAIDIFDRESEPSDTVSAKPVNRFYPLRIWSLKVNAHNWSDTPEILLRWIPNRETDIAYYEIHRAGTQDFVPQDSTLLETVSGFTFTDSTNLKILKKYYYRIIAVDKGGLKSKPGNIDSDIILDKPVPVFPPDNSNTSYFKDFKIITSAYPANYKIFITSSPVGEVLHEINTQTNLISDTLSVPVGSFAFEVYKTYYWQIHTFTKNLDEPNSISRQVSFTIIPDL